MFEILQHKTSSGTDTPHHTTPHHTTPHHSTLHHTTPHHTTPHTNLQTTRSGILLTNSRMLSKHSLDSQKKKDLYSQRKRGVGGVVVAKCDRRRKNIRPHAVGIELTTSLKVIQHSTASSVQVSFFFFFFFLGRGYDPSRLFHSF